MTIFLTDADVRSVFDWRLAIAALRHAYSLDIDEVRYPPRTMARGQGTWLRTLSGVAPDSGLMGAKLIAVSSTTHASYLIPLFDQETSALVALLDGHSVTGFRTAATSALAADLLAPAGTLAIAVIGSGFEAKNHVRAIAAIRDFKSVQVYSPRAESRTQFTRELSDLACPVTAAESPQAALVGADLVICAARARDEAPTLRGQWLSAGMTVVSIGSTLPEQREVDPDVLAKANFLVADMVNEVLEDTGDLVAARDAGVDAEAKTYSLGDLVTGRRAGRTASDEVALYKSVGSAVQDLAVATMCLRRAEELGVGTLLSSTIQPVRK